MKAAIILFFILAALLTKAQDQQSCRLSKTQLDLSFEELELWYGMNIEKPIEVIFYVTGDCSDDLQLISNWARMRGYLIQTAENTDADTAVALKKTTNYFSNYIHESIYHDIERGLDLLGKGCFTTKIDTCSFRKQKQVIDFYNRNVRDHQQNLNHVFFYQFILFDQGKEKHLDKLREWAASGGFSFKISPIEYESEDGEMKKFTEFMIEKILGACDLNCVVETVNGTTRKLRELRITQCVNSGMGTSYDSQTD